MLKGIQQKMVVIKTPTSRYYTRACFILRQKLPEVSPRKEDMVKEARRILADSLHKKSAHAPSGENRHRTNCLLFFTGMLCGGALSALFTLPFLLN